MRHTRRFSGTLCNLVPCVCMRCEFVENTPLVVYIHNKIVCTKSVRPIDSGTACVRLFGCCLHHYFTWRTKALAVSVRVRLAGKKVPTAYIYATSYIKLRRPKALPTCPRQQSLGSIKADKFSFHRAHLYAGSFSHAEGKLKFLHSQVTDLFIRLGSGGKRAWLETISRNQHEVLFLSVPSDNK